MRCNACHENEGELECGQCHHVYCSDCEPDDNGICYRCRTENEASEARERAFTNKLRKWFAKPLPGPEPPDVDHKIPWKAQEVHGRALIFSDGFVLCTCHSMKDARFIAKAVNSWQALAQVAVITYNRVRHGRVIFTGTPEDVEMFKKLKEGLK